MTESTDDVEREPADSLAEVQIYLGLCRESLLKSSFTHGDTIEVLHALTHAVDHLARAVEARRE